MINKRLLINFTMLLVIFCLTILTINNIKVEQKIVEQLNTEQSTSQMVTVTKSDGEIDLVQLDEYLVGVVAGEMPLSFSDEALKAQIVASRTYAANRNFIVTDNTSSQVYLTPEKLMEKWQGDYIINYNRIKNLVLASGNEVLTYEDKLISALFFSTSNGRTEDADNYWSQSVAYLQAVDSPWDKSVSPVFNDEKIFSRSELETIFGVTNFHIEIISINENNRVSSVAVNGKEYTGKEIRELLGLRSTDFAINQAEDVFTFHTTGFGHGVGMSQYGAQGMAIEGYNYQQILVHYYTGAKISSL